jgi:hypothetical protein
VSPKKKSHSVVLLIIVFLSQIVNIQTGLKKCAYACVYATMLGSSVGRAVVVIRCATTRDSAPIHSFTRKPNRINLWSFCHQHHHPTQTNCFSEPSFFLCHGTLGRRQVDTGTMNLSVQEKGIQSQNDSGQGKNDGKGRGGATTMVGITTLGANVSRGLFQLGEDTVDVKATSGIGVKVRVVATVHVVFALGRSVVGTFAQIEDLVVIVVIVVVGVVTVVAVVVVVAIV